MAGATLTLLSFTREGAPSPGLTAAETQIAVALIGGHSNAAIGRLRGSSTRTVANQVASIYRKLGVHSRTELTARWSDVLSLASR